MKFNTVLIIINPVCHGCYSIEEERKEQGGVKITNGGPYMIKNSKGFFSIKNIRTGHVETCIHGKHLTSFIMPNKSDHETVD